MNRIQGLADFTADSRLTKQASQEIEIGFGTHLPSGKPYAIWIFGVSGQPACCCGRKQEKKSLRWTRSFDKDPIDKVWSWRLRRYPLNHAVVSWHLPY